MIADRYLVVQRWRPNFDPWRAKVQRKIVVWVRIPLLPLEFYNAASLKKIGLLIGRTLKIDRITYASERGRYARMCVEIDLNKRLTAAINIFCRKCYVEYEGLHLICFNCGKYGHHKDVCLDKVISQCTINQQEDSKIDQEGGVMQGPEGESAKAMEGSTESGQKEENKHKRSRVSLDGKSDSGDVTLSTKEGLGVWNLVQRPHRRKPGNQGHEGRESRREEIYSKGNGQGNLPQPIIKEGASEIEKGKKSLWGPSNHQNEHMQKKSMHVSAKLGGPNLFVKDSSNKKKWVPIAPINNKKGAKEEIYKMGPVWKGQESSSKQEQRVHFLNSPNPFQALEHEDCNENMEEERVTLTIPEGMNIEKELEIQEKVDSLLTRGPKSNDSPINGGDFNATLYHHERYSTAHNTVSVDKNFLYGLKTLNFMIWDAMVRSLLGKGKGVRVELIVLFATENSWIVAEMHVLNIFLGSNLIIGRSYFRIKISRSKARRIGLFDL
ncbi:hypothetical protein K1719_016523 [Acacia pycnantha]|nr:hypothetical protein K1719_016523 [Acacia pycnantha]